MDFLNLEEMTGVGPGEKLLFKDLLSYILNISTMLIFAGLIEVFLDLARLLASLIYLFPNVLLGSVALRD